MSTYVLPQVRVFQEFTASPAAQQAPLCAHISGGHAQLIRFNEATEQVLGELGIYDALNDTAYDWPNRQAGGIVDQSYVKLWAKNAILRYFQESAGSPSAITKTAVNRVTSAATNFTTANGFARDASLLDRDVQLGDIVKARFGSTTVWSYVAGFVADIVASSLGTPARDGANSATHSGATSTHQQISGPWNSVEMTASSAASYDPFPTGKVTETYTVVVIASSNGGDLTTARLRVLSASGLDNQASVTPSASGVATNIGTHGATVTFSKTHDAGESASAETQDVSPDDLLVGQKWQVVVNANFTQIAAPSAGGTYTGTTDTTYVVTVVSGKKYASGAPQIKVTTNTGVDISGPTFVTAAGVAVPIGTKGVTVTFAGLGLVKGDRFYVPVVAAHDGPVRTLVLGNNIPSTVTNGASCDLTLYIKQASLQIGQDRTGFAPLQNFTMSDTQITVTSGIEAYDPTWTDGGVQQPLPLDSDAGQGYSDLFVEYRAWLATLATTVGSIDDVGNIDTAIPGPLTPDNPLKWAVSKALANSNGVPVKFSAVANPASVDSWTATLGLLVGRTDVYGLVPLTHDPTVLNLYAAHVNDQSSPEQAEWRVVWVNLSAFPTVPVVSAGSSIAGFTAATTSDGATALATITDDPDATGTQYTIVTVPAGNAKFVTNGVQPGDVVRALYTGDGFGGTTYSEYVVDAVQTEDQLRLLAGPDAPVNVAAKIEVWRNLNLTQESAQIAKTAGAYGDRRVRAVYPERVGSGGTLQDGFHLCAALAGLASGILPQQGMTHLAISGFDDLTRTTRFNRAQLDDMAGSGAWIVTQDPSGNVFTRHAVTTGATADVNQREEMITRDVDSISYYFQSLFAPYIGVANVTPNTVELLRIEIETGVSVLQQAPAASLTGGQLVDATLTDLRQHAVLKDHVVAELDLTLPYPLNNFDLTLVI